MRLYGILSNGQKFNQLKSFENLKFEAYQIVVGLDEECSILIKAL